jgi:membrane protein implicated in regulation of membrane protease activity
MLLIAFLAVELYLSGHTYLATIAGSVGVVLFTVKSMETIQLSHPEERKLIGQRCLVVKQVGKGKTGIVRVYDRIGRLDPELWSAESEHEISEGREAEIEGMRSIVLLIKPKD